MNETRDYFLRRAMHMQAVAAESHRMFRVFQSVDNKYVALHYQQISATQYAAARQLYHFSKEFYDDDNTSWS